MGGSAVSRLDDGTSERRSVMRNMARRSSWVRGRKGGAGSELAPPHGESSSLRAASVMLTRHSPSVSARCFICGLSHVASDIRAVNCHVLPSCRLLLCTHPADVTCPRPVSDPPQVGFVLFFHARTCVLSYRSVPPVLSSVATDSVP